MDWQFSEPVARWANDILVWVGFGTLVGLMAKAIMPGRDPGGAVATLMMGIGGSVIGGGTLLYFDTGDRVTPISPIGFLVATAGAFVLLFFYRMLAGKLVDEAIDGPQRVPRRARRRRRREPSNVYEE